MDPNSYAEPNKMKFFTKDSRASGKVDGPDAYDM
jgi:hypothetical protein